MTLSRHEHLLKYTSNAYFSKDLNAVKSEADPCIFKNKVKGGGGGEVGGI